MSQPDQELANDPGEESIESIAFAMGGDDEGDLPEDEQDEDVAVDDDPDGDGGDEGSEGSEDDPDRGGEDDPEIEIEAGGKKEKVKLSELRAGYMKDADYRRKTAEVAEQRRTVEQMGQQYQQKLQSAANQLDVHLASLQQTLIGSQPKPDLIESDPQEYLRQQSEYQQRVQQFQGAMQRRQALQAEQAQEMQRQQQEFAAEEGKKLLEKLPGWRDEKTRTAESADIARYLTELGYSADEMNGLIDHRALLVARDAAKFRQLQAAKAKQAKPAPPKPVRPGAAAPVTRPNNQVQRAHERLRRNPNDMDALSSLVGASSRT